MERVYWYSLFDLPSSRMAVTRHKESEGSAYYRHFYFGLLREDGTPKEALAHFDPAWGICQWLHYDDYCGLDETVRWLRKLGVKRLRTGLSWADSTAPDALTLVRPYDERAGRVRADDHSVLYPAQPRPAPRPYQPAP